MISFPQKRQNDVAQKKVSYAVSRNSKEQKEDSPKTSEHSFVDSLYCLYLFVFAWER